MTTTYDPDHPTYVDEADVRGELTRVFDVCHGCGKCVDLCRSFPTLFEMLGRQVDHDPGRLTPAQQDEVVDECVQCKMCSAWCPYTPDLHEWSVDFPRLVLRAKAMQHTAGIPSLRSRVRAQVACRTDLLGGIATSSSIVNKMLGSRAGALFRETLRSAVGVPPDQLLAPHPKQRLSAWFEQRPSLRSATRQRTVTVYPTCLVEYHATSIGRALIEDYEASGVGCSMSDAGCCGAPWLHSGDIGHFTKVAARNLTTLAAEIRRGTDIVVPTAVCRNVVTHDYGTYVGGADSELVAAHTFDAVDYLASLS